MTAMTLIAVIMGIATPSAIAQQQRHNPVERCIERIVSIADHTVQFNRHVADNTVEAIRVLDNEGAPDEVIIATARVAKGTIDNRSQRANERIHAVAQRCIDALRAHDAPQEAIIAVERAAQGAHAAIARSVERTKARINEAVHNAIG